MKNKLDLAIEARITDMENNLTSEKKLNQIIDSELENLSEEPEVGVTYHVNNVKALMELKQKERELDIDSLRALNEVRTERNKSRLSPDTIVSSAVNLAGILLVLNFEQFNVVRSKAFSMIKNTFRR